MELNDSIDFFPVLYDLSYQPQNFGTYMVNVYLTLIDQNYLESAKIVLKAIKNLLTLYEDKMELSSISKLFLSDDYKNVNSKKYGNGISGWTEPCFDLLLEESHLRNDPFFKEYEGRQKMSPCKNLTIYAECRDYCDWHKNLTTYERFSRHDFFSLMR